MKGLETEHGVSEICRALAVSRSGYYGWCQAQKKTPAGARFDDEIREVYQEHRGRYGSPRVTRALKQKAVRCSENRVARRMKALGLAARPRRGYVPRTTDSRHGGPICANLLLERETAPQPHQVWLGDITYVATGEGWLYLAGFLDVATRRLVGWSVGETLEASLVCRGLHEAKPSQGGTHHPHRSRQPVRQWGLPETTRKNPRRAQHEPPRQLLRQCHDGIVLEHAQSRVFCQLPARHALRGPQHDLRVHRDLLQPNPASQFPPLSIPDGL